MRWQWALQKNYLHSMLSSKYSMVRALAIDLHRSRVAPSKAKFSRLIFAGRLLVRITLGQKDNPLFETYIRTEDKNSSLVQMCMC